MAASLGTVKTAGIERAFGGEGNGQGGSAQNEHREEIHDDVAVKKRILEVVE